jgi:tRNA nucleotidyltransferase/poly(A) polymerase
MIELPPEIKKDIDKIDTVAKDLQMKVYIVGGFPRDIVMGKGINEDTDLDITEAYGNAFDLAFFVSAKYNLMEPQIYESTGTAFVKMESGRDVEFHNAFFNVPHIIDQLYSIDIEPTPLNKDIYSRDFTINTLLFDPDSGKILDITGNGISDIENRILRTPLSPSKILSRSPKNILRGIRFTVEFGLKVDEEYERTVPQFIPNLVEFLKENPNSQMVIRTVKKTFQANPEQAIAEYEKYGLMEHIPHTEEMNKTIKNKMFGTTISPVAQTRMIDHLMKERDKHKSYMRRKKREKTDRTKEKFEILDRAKSGYYTNNPEPEFLKDRKIDKNNKILNYVRSEDN